jgi:methylmalonyl-CoA mutase cobalamin-binding subunit/DNA-binding transcriptional MerR regulator
MNVKRKPRAVDGEPLSIGALSRATRIPAETLRTWERRYGSPRPVRKPSGHRVYAAASVDHLRRVVRLLAQGHRPGEILGLSPNELDALLSLSAPARSRVSGTIAADSDPRAIDRSITEMLQGARDFDRASLMEELRAHWVRLGPLGFLEDLAGPFMTAIGAAWKTKALDIRHEHFASACLAGFLTEVREPYDRRARGPRVVAAMLPGDNHEGGLLMASVLLSVHGHRVVYLGPDTPVKQIAAAAGVGGVEAVAISVSSGQSRDRAAKAIAQLRRTLPSRMPIWVGGAGAPPPMGGVERFDGLKALDARLAAG